MSNLAIAALALGFFVTFFAGFAFGWRDRDREVSAKIDRDGVLIIPGIVIDEREQ